MSAIWPSAVATDADLYVAKNSLQTTLGTAVNSAVTTVVLASATGFPTAGGVTIDNEVIFYTGVSGSSLTGCTRGADGTTAAAHSVGVPVGASIIAFHHNGLMAEIEAIESYLDTVLGKGTSVTATEFGYVHGVTSALQTQLNLKAPLAGPTFTGTVTVPTPFTVGAVSVTATGTEMNYLVGVSSAVQTQLNLKAPLASPTFTGTVTAPNVAITDVSNQFVLGATRTVTLTAPTPASTSRTVTLPDLSANYSVVGTAGAQTIGGVKTMSSDFQVQSGASTPFIFNGTTGAHDSLNVKINSSTLLQLRDDGLLWHSDGTVSLPGISFISDTDTGIYPSAANEISVATAGTQRLKVDSAGSIFGTTSGAELGVLNTYNSISVASVGSTSASITNQNSKTFTLTIGPSMKTFVLSLSNGDSCLVVTSFLTSTITLLGAVTSIVASSSPAAAQLGIFKSSSSHVISFKSGSSLTGTASATTIMVLSGSVSAATNWA